MTDKIKKKKHSKKIKEVLEDEVTDVNKESVILLERSPDSPMHVLFDQNVIDRAHTIHRAVNAPRQQINLARGFSYLNQD